MNRAGSALRCFYGGPVCLCHPESRKLGSWAHLRSPTQLGPSILDSQATRGRLSSSATSPLGALSDWLSPNKSRQMREGAMTDCCLLLAAQTLYLAGGKAPNELPAPGRA